ncbi:MAG: hypothetical protein HY929_01245 [Euryarchaeota archaeon]|nr:hypothetical protein [Euryarchaeota archaeon]
MANIFKILPNYLFIYRKRKKEKISSKTICGKIRKYLDLGKGEAESIVLSKEEKGGIRSPVECEDYLKELEELFSDLSKASGKNESQGKKVLELSRH